MWIFRKPNKQLFMDWRGYIIAVALVFLATILKLLSLPNIITYPNSLPYILAIVITAVFFGFGPAIFTSILSVFAYDFFFIDPFNSFKFPSLQVAVTLTIFLLVGIIVSFLTSGLRNKTEEAVRESTLRKQNEIELIKYRDHLESLVNQRTAELKKAKNELENRVKERTLELEESEKKYRLLVENANEAVMVFQDMKFKFFNHKALEISGYSQEELASKSIDEIIHPEDKELVIGRYFKRLQGENVPASYEFRIVNRDGKIKWLEMNVVMITWDAQPAVLGLLTDITQTREMNLELQAYARRITRVQEEERKRIAYELHDDTVQYLSILKLQLDSLTNSGKIQSPEIVEKLKYLEKDAGRALDDVRRYSHELRPGILEHLGLKAALEQIIEDINKIQQITIELNVEGEEPALSEDIKLGFFRIAQEAINNIRKHAKASKVSIDLCFNGNQTEMKVTDNGVGFDVPEAKTRISSKGNLGLMSMQERASLMGADLKIESRIGQGNTVTVSMSSPN
jgi:PAS domain S-box-containing protein